MVLMAGFDEFARVVQSKTFGFVGRNILYDSFDNTGVWEALTIPTYIANGDSDWMISDSHGRRAARRMTGPHHFELLDGFGHTDLPLGQIIVRANNHSFNQVSKQQ